MPAELKNHKQETSVLLFWASSSRSRKR